LRDGGIVDITCPYPVAFQEKVMSRLTVILVILFPCLALAQPAQPEPLVALVCYPGGPVRARDAKPAMDSMLRVIEESGHWSPGSITAHFTSKVDECRKFMKEKDPHIMFISLGLYLESKAKHNLVPVAQPNIDGKKTDTYRILVLKDKYRTLTDLKGKTLGGTHLTEPKFLKRIVFKSQIDPQSHFKLKPSRRALRALRNLNRGKLDAVIINQQQYKSLGSLKFADQLAAVFTSDPIPLAGLVANGKKTTKDERGRLTQALSAMCSHSKGKELCEMFGVEAFVPADASAFKKIMLMWR
jgi:ABC-type phosphate/phosphonate transport system substrate-binding protein